MNKRRKILYAATSDIHIKTFHIPYLKWLKGQGFEVHLAIEKRGDVDLSFCDSIHYIPFKRNPFHPKNIPAFRLLKRIISTYNFEIIHCHTPAVSVITRLASLSARRKGTIVMYTAHGFHFFKGAPLKFWLLFYPIEKLLSLFTDVIVTINREDFNLILNKFWNKRSYYIKGIGVQTEKFKTVLDERKFQLRIKHNIPSASFVLIYVAEFIDRKNQTFVIKALPELVKSIPNLIVLFVGRGPMLESVKKMTIERCLTDSTRFLGWRDDVEELAALSDIGISASKQEGLGLGLAEEMLCSIPIVATMDRGHREMIIHGENGYMFQQENVSEFVKYIIELYKDPNLRRRLGKRAHQTAQEFSIGNSLKSMAEIYEKTYKRN